MAKDVVGVLVAIVVLAGIAVAVASGSNTANVMSSAADGFSNVIKAATLRG
jgi:hypothetical protein